MNDGSRFSFEGVALVLEKSDPGDSDGQELSVRIELVVPAPGVGVPMRLYMNRVRITLELLPERES
jgi:hypothetical protein